MTRPHCAKHKRIAEVAIALDTVKATIALAATMSLDMDAVFAAAVGSCLFRFRRDTRVMVWFNQAEVVLDLSVDMRFMDVLARMHDQPSVTNAEENGASIDVTVVHRDKVTLHMTADYLPSGKVGWSNALRCLIEHAVREPTTCLGALRMLPDDACRSLVQEINQCTDELSDSKSPEVLFDEWAKVSPELLALITDDGTVTYGELNTRVKRFAGFLVMHGAGPERPVALHLERSVELVVALLAVLRCSAPYVPLDHRMPAKRMREILTAAGADLVISDKAAASADEALGVSVVYEQHSYPNGTPSAIDVASPDQTAYIYFTSGSTGKPKGVMTDRQCAARRVNWTARRYDLGPGSTVLHKTPLIFDVAIIEILAPLTKGGAVRIAAPRTETDVAYLAGVLSREQITWVHFVPSMLQVFIGGVRNARFPNVRWVTCSGEVVPAHLARQARRLFSSASFHNHYGQTETSEVTCWEGEPEGNGKIPIGAQIGGYRLFVLDLMLRPVPAEVPGEIYIAGVGGLASGYRAQPALTAERFVANPYSIVPGERLYRTGDVGVRDTGGEITFTNRIDDQVKIGGARVEPAEVETVIAACPAVRQCAVIVRSDGRGDHELVAYIVGGQAATHQVREWVSTRIAPYLVPSAFVLLAELPYTPSGKLDRASLPTPALADRVIRSSGNIEPATPLEAALCTIWAEVLGLERVSPTDDFFSLHGNSLKAADLLTRISSRFGVHVDVGDLYGNPDVRSLTTVVAQRRQTSAVDLSTGGR